MARQSRPTAVTAPPPTPGAASPGQRPTSLDRPHRTPPPCRAALAHPSTPAALKCVYLAVMSMDPKGTGRKRWMMRWKAALNAFDIAFEGRLTTTRN